VRNKDDAITMRQFRIMTKVEDGNGETHASVAAEGVELTGGICVLAWSTKPHGVYQLCSIDIIDELLTKSDDIEWLDDGNTIKNCK